MASQPTPPTNEPLPPRNKGLIDSSQGKPMVNPPWSQGLLSGGSTFSHNCFWGNSATLLKLWQKKVLWFWFPTKHVKLAAVTIFCTETENHQFAKRHFPLWPDPFRATARCRVVSTTSVQNANAWTLPSDLIPAACFRRVLLSSRIGMDIMRGTRTPMPRFSLWNKALIEYTGKSPLPSLK